MELRSIMIATITLYSGLFYLTGDLQEMPKYIILVLMIVVNVYFVLFWCYHMFGAGISLLRETFPFLRRCLGQKGLRDGYGDALNVHLHNSRHYYFNGNTTVCSII